MSGYVAWKIYLSLSFHLIKDKLVLKKLFKMVWLKTCKKLSYKLIKSESFIIKLLCFNNDSVTVCLKWGN